MIISCIASTMCVASANGNLTVVAVSSLHLQLIMHEGVVL